MIAVSEAAARLIPIAQVAKLNRQPTGLHRIEPSIVAFDVVVVLLCLAMITNHLHPLGQGFVIGRDRASFTTSAKILSGIKAESRCLANRACFFPSIGLL